MSSRILLYSHDTFGLGHLRRTLALAGQFARDLPHAHQLLLTGSMVAGAFSLPPRLDLVKLPALSKRSDGRYQARALPLSLGQTIAWREQMILQAVEAFEPDLVLVDKTPAGVGGELLPTLDYLKTRRPQTRLVLGMRDIEDDPATTLAEWESSDTARLQSEVYDAILYYGERRVFDPVREYEMSQQAAAKMVECGYLGQTPRVRPREVVRRELGADGMPLLVVTAGGGGDGYPLIKTFLELASAAPALKDMYSLVVTGPLMTADKRLLLEQTARNDHVTLVEFTPDILSYVAAADLVVSMAGYNTVCENLSLGVRSLFVPRVRPRTEQAIRATRLAGLGLAHVLMPDELTEASLEAAIKATLAAPLPRVNLNMKGLERASRAIGQILDTRTSLPEDVRLESVISM